jgi:hypothetical protein
MPTIVVGNEKNFSALRPVLFQGRVPAATATEVADRIKEANPTVDLDRLQPGTVLTIPEGLPGVVVEPQPGVVVTTGSTDPPIRAVPAHGKLELDALADASKAAAAAARNDRKGLAKAFASGALDAAMKRDKQLAAAIAGAKDAVAEEDAAAKERAAELKKAQAEWQAGLDALAERARQLPGVDVVQTRAKASRGSPS